MPAEKFYFLAQEKSHPYPYAVYTLSDEAIEYGHARNEQALALALRCEEEQHWPCYNIREETGVTTFKVEDLW